MGLADMDATSLDHSRPISFQEIVYPARMTQAERKSLGQRLYAVHALVFSGSSEQDFYKHVIDPPASRTAVQIYRGKEGDLAGYCAIHSFERRLRGRHAVVLRAEAGLRRDYRGRGATHWFGMSQTFLEKLRHPFTPVYYFGTLVHPSSYRFFCKYFPRVYPHPRHGMPKAMKAIALELADSFQDPAVDPKDPLIRDVGWITIEASDERRVRHRDDLAVKSEICWKFD